MSIAVRFVPFFIATHQSRNTPNVTACHTTPNTLNAIQNHPTHHRTFAVRVVRFDQSPLLVLDETNSRKKYIRYDRYCTKPGSSRAYHGTAGRQARHWKNHFFGPAAAKCCSWVCPARQPLFRVPCVPGAKCVYANNDTARKLYREVPWKAQRQRLFSLFCTFGYKRREIRFCTRKNTHCPLRVPWLRSWREINWHPPPGAPSPAARWPYWCPTGAVRLREPIDLTVARNRTFRECYSLRKRSAASQTFLYFPLVQPYGAHIMAGWQLLPRLNSRPVFTTSVPFLLAPPPPSSSSSSSTSKHP